MDYLTFHVREQATEEIKAFLHELGSGASNPPTYSFVPGESGCKLSVAAEGGPELSLSLAHCVHVEEDPVAPDQATRWRTPQYHGSLPPEATEVGVKEIVFWIDGALMARLEEMGWTRAQLHGFDYRFGPAGNEVTISARGRGEGQWVELTGGLA
ncbi:MAG: hypothetical protein RRC07_14515 [Anaerolineae bacterium]|nr:hypothetical protein [Anaerolineae bacterium]